MKINKRFIVITLCAIFFMNLFMYNGTTAYANDATPQNATKINVLDCGADPSGAKDSALAIQKAIEAAKKIEGLVIIDFPKGTYQIYPDKAAERELYISNTVGADANYKMKKIGILLEDMNDVVIEGNGSLFNFHGKMTTFATINSENIVFQNFDVDFEVPTVIDITVESVTENSATVYIPESYNYEINGTSIVWKSDKSPYTGSTYWTSTNGMNYSQIYDVKTGLTVRGANQIFSGVSSIEELGNNRVKFNYVTRPTSIQAGLSYQMRPTVRDHAGSLIWQSKNVELKNLNIYFLHGFGMVGQLSENITLDNVDFETPKGSGRTTAGYADFIQMSGCKGLIEVKNSTFSNPHDDPINIHGTFLQVVERIANNKFKVRYMHNETAGFPNFYVGDEVEFMTKGNMIPVENSVAKVVEVQGPTGNSSLSGSLTDIIITLDKDMPVEIVANQHVVENITYTPSVKIHNNIFKETPTRGILVTTRKPVVIEDNIFDGMGMAAIYISNDAQGWYESGPARDVIIRNNIFKRSGRGIATQPVIYIDPTNPTVSTDKTVHENINIYNNKFYMVDTNVLGAKSVNNLVFENNEIYRLDPNVELSITSENTKLKIGDTVTINNTSTGTSLGSNLYSFNGCKNVSLKNNSYDGGLKLNASLSNMNTSDVKVEEKENILLNGNANLSNPTGKVYYKSSDESVVKISDSGKVTAIGNGNANITAYSIVGERKFESNTIPFNVNENNAGVGEDNGSYQYTLSDNFTVVNPNNEKWSVLGDDKIQILAQSGSLWGTGTANNVIVANLNKDLTNVSATVKVTGKTKSGWDEAGLIFYKDNDNYIAVQRKHAGGNPKIHVVTEKGGAGNEDGAKPNIDADEIYYKIEKQGDEFVGYYSADNSNWTEIRRVTNSGLGNNFKIGVIAAGGTLTNTPFEFSELTIDGEKKSLTQKTLKPGEDNGNSYNNELESIGSANSYLKSASITGVGAFNNFDKKNKYYLATAGINQDKVNVNFASEDSDANVQVVVNGIEVSNKKSDFSKENIELNSGLNEIQVNVQAADSISFREYRFIVIRTGDSTRVLNNLKINGTELNEFEPNKLNYTYIAEKGAKSVSLEAMGIPTRATVMLSSNGKLVNSNNGEFNVKEGSNQIFVAVNPETSHPTTFYTINVKVPKEDNANLESLNFTSGVSLKESFDFNLTKYTGNVLNNNVTINLKAEEEKATIKLKSNGITYSEEGKLIKNLDMFVGENDIQIEVASPNGKEKKIYSIKLNGSESVSLSSMNWKDNSFTGWGAIQKDKSAGGNAITLIGDNNTVVPFEKGIGTHATSKIYYNIENLGFDKFETYLGIDGAQKGSVARLTIKIYIDGNEAFNSGELSSADKMKFASLDVKGAKELILYVDKGEVDHNDHASFGNPKFLTNLSARNEHKVEVEANNIEAGIVSGAGNVVYGNEATINATAKEGYEFVNWTLNGEVVSTEASYTFAVTKDVKLIANFKEKEQEPEKIDKTELGIAIDYAKDAKEKDEYKNLVPVAEKEFDEALEEAEEVFANENAIEAQVDLASKRLINIIHMLGFQKGDKVELEALITRVEGLNESSYTSLTWAKLQTELKEAKKVFADENVMEKEISKAYENLNNAFKNLELSVDKSKLEKLVIELEAKDLSKHTQGTVSKFNTELANAKAILAKSNATKKEISEAYNKLIKAYLDLRLIPDKSKLEELLNKAQAIDTTKYTTASVYRFSSHLSNVRVVLTNENATQAQVDEAQKGLELVMASLELKDGAINNDKKYNNTGKNDTNKVITKEDYSSNSNSIAINGKGNSKLPSTGGASAVAAGSMALLMIGIGIVIRRRNNK